VSMSLSACLMTSFGCSGENLLRWYHPSFVHAPSASRQHRLTFWHARRKRLVAGAASGIPWFLSASWDVDLEQFFQVYTPRRNKALGIRSRSNQNRLRRYDRSTCGPDSTKYGAVWVGQQCTIVNPCDDARIP
jgi:hypothetical protein